jgi:hypothetical protein
MKYHQPPIWNGNVERSDQKVVNSGDDHYGKNKSRTCNFTRSPQPQSTEVNEDHQIWEIHSDRWMWLGSSNSGQLRC